MVPDGVEPLVGWRVWALVEQAGRYRLSSLVYPAVWEPGRPFASVCRRRLAALPWARLPLHEPPGFDCVCGIYAARDPARALAYLRFGAARAAAEGLRAAGTVAVWGRVVEADRGWRGQLGYPCRLVVSPDGRRLRGRHGRRLTARIAADLEAYGVEVQVADPSILLTSQGVPRSGTPGAVSLGSGMGAR